jgi:hypothetical protein
MKKTTTAPAERIKKMFVFAIYKYIEFTKKFMKQKL